MSRFARRLAAILRLRCPACLEGKVFHGSVAMHDHCPRCGVSFHPEQGFYLGAMYASYFLGAGLLIVTTLLLTALFPALDPYLATAIAVLLYLPLIPMIFRYSRVIWMHIDTVAFLPPESEDAEKPQKVSR